MARMPHPAISRVGDEFLAAGKAAGGEAGGGIIARQHTLASYRLVIRLLTEMQLRGVVALARLVDQDYLGGNAFVALLAEAGRWRPDARDDAAAQAQRPITIRAMARSFHRPYETMRRALHRLSELGLVDLGEDGVVLRHGVEDRADVHEYLCEMHDIMVTFLEDLFVFARLPVPENSRPETSHSETGQRLIKLAGLDLHLLSVEGMQGIFSDWTGLLLAAAITAGNIRKVTYDPALAFAYAAADRVPPMGLRRPVLFRTLCDTLPLCPTTAWRRIAVMKMLGSIQTIDGGLVLDGKWLAHPTLIANACDRIERTHAIINRMVQGGVSLKAIDELYIRGRVDPIPL